MYPGVMSNRIGGHVPGVAVVRYAKRTPTGLACIILACSGHADIVGAQPGFPDTQGFGARATGGRLGAVVRMAKRDASGPPRQAAGRSRRRRTADPSYSTFPASSSAWLDDVQVVVIRDQVASSVAKAWHLHVTAQPKVFFAHVGYTSERKSVTIRDLNSQGAAAWSATNPNGKPDINQNCLAHPPEQLHGGQPVGQRARSRRMRQCDGRDNRNRDSRHVARGRRCRAHRHVLHHWRPRAGTVVGTTAGTGPAE